MAGRVGFAKALEGMDVGVVGVEVGWLEGGFLNRAAGFAAPANGPVNKPFWHQKPAFVMTTRLFRYEQ